MGAYVCFTKHIEISKETRNNGVISSLGYKDIDAHKINEIADNKKVKYIQISDYLSKEAYQIIDQILMTALI